MAGDHRYETEVSLDQPHRYDTTVGQSGDQQPHAYDYTLDDGGGEQNPYAYTLDDGGDGDGDGETRYAEELDEQLVGWVESNIQQAEQQGRLADLAEDLEPTGDVLESGELASIFEQLFAEEAEQESAEDEPQTQLAAPTVDEIREKIFAKLRRPAGAPYAAGYQHGPARIRAEYADEDKKIGWRAKTAPDFAAKDYITTSYESRDTIGDRAAHQRSGLVYDSNGAPITGTFGWVMDEQTGYLLLFEMDQMEVWTREGVKVSVHPDRGMLKELVAMGWNVKVAHHSTPVAGMPVTGAGEITLDQGRIVQVNDQSGHYRPDAIQQYIALVELMAQGYDLSQAKIMLGGAKTDGRPTDKAGWLYPSVMNNLNFPTGEVQLRPEQFEQTQGDEYQIRAKIALNEELHARVPEVAPTTETSDDAIFVARAREYLRDNGLAAFAAWFNTLDDVYQELLLADPEISGAWTKQPTTPKLSPTEADLDAAAARNKEVVDALKDGQSAPFIVGGLLLLVGDGHKAEYDEYVRSYRDAISGQVTVRKARVARGAGTLAFSNSAAGKEDLIRSSVRRFSRKDVRFV